MKCDTGVGEPVVKGHSVFTTIATIATIATLGEFADKACIANFSTCQFVSSQVSCDVHLS